MRYLYVALLLSSFIINTAEGFDNKRTHRDITKAASNTPTFASYIINLGFNDGLNTKFPDKSGKDILLLLQDGSDEEDTLTSMCRASNHFLNPTKTWDKASLTDQVFLQTTICSSWYPIHSTVAWATGYLTPPGLGTGQKDTFNTNPDYAPVNWDMARNFFYNALTSSVTTDRDTNFAGTFNSLGHVLHLLQDMAVPPHVRDDFAGSHFSFIGINSWDITEWVANLFEYYVKNHPDAIYKTASYPTTITRVTDLWDTTQYRTTGNPAVTLNAGLAEYTNANYVSDSTVLKKLPYPNKNTSVQKLDYDIPDPFNNGNTIKRQYYKKVADGDSGYRLAGVDYLWVYRQNLSEPELSTAESVALPPMDDYVHADYADRLLPRAVGYSAALLDYFFRGKIKLTLADPEDITFRSIKVTAQNDTTGEAMGIGDVSLIIRYKALAETPLGSGKYKLNYPSADYSYKVVTLKNVNLATPQPLTFDFGNAPLPINFSDMTMQLVFKGKLGNEDNSVAVSELKPIDAIYTDFDLSLPQSGVYAKTSDGDPTTANFNELRVTALTDLPGGLTGGTISLALEYRTAIDDQFQSVPVDTEPVDAAGYVFRTPAKNGINALPQGVPVELAFDLPQLPVQATDVEINIIYTKADGTQNIGYLDISEPTPVDVYNNTDYTCLNGGWYLYNDPVAIALANQTDINPHTISNISFLAGPADAGNLDATTSNTFSVPGPLATGQMLRMGYILTDIANRYAINEIRTGQNGDPWPHVDTNNRIFPGTGFRNDETGWSSMFTFRNTSTRMWWGTSVIFVNKEYPMGSSCTFEALNQKLGL